MRSLLVFLNLWALYIDYKSISQCEFVKKDVRSTGFPRPELEYNMCSDECDKWTQLEFERVFSSLHVM